VRGLCVSRLALLALLTVEILYLTIRFDSQALDEASSPWLRLVAWSPQYLRLAITIAVVTLLLKGRRLWSRAGPDAARASSSSRIAWLVVHAAAGMLFVQVSSVVFDVAAAGAHPAFWAGAWLFFGAATLASWVLAFSPRRLAIPRPGRGWALAALGAGLGAGAWLSGFLTEALWPPLARYTFALVGMILGSIYPEVVSDPARLVLGTPTFKVTIAAACSGYEGVGLLLAFLSIYLWLFRRELRFPGALVLLPIGAVTIWLLNVLRIALLIVIGTSGWPAVALGGFHSQAGWIAFNVVGLGFVAVLNRGRFFMTPAAEPQPAETADEPTTAYLAPFLVVIGSAMFTGAFSSGLDWLYPVRVIAAVWVLWVFRKSYSSLGWTLSWRAVAIGCGTFAIWIALVPAGPAESEGWPVALQSVPVHWAAAWLLLRVVGYTITVPIVEELAFRGYLTRRLIRPDFQHLPIGLFTWFSFAVSSVLFGALHGGFWLAGTIAGMGFALALYQRRAIGDAVLAHATTNGLIAVYVFATGRWSVWS
jgi:exosortase E/protease (VPEID-CTERM system)